VSRVDSWSRCSKSEATPTPFYVLPGSEATPYCHSCRRFTSTQKKELLANT
ncbi:hypothetical protein IWW34DRAFT_553873, partial [Fusarium oxysporum f. sp. albedinis]